MRKSQRFFYLIIVVMMAALVFPSSVSAAALEEDKIIFGESYTLESGNTLKSNLLIVGGVLKLETGSTVTGNVITISSVVTIDGTVAGNVTAMAGTLTLEKNAVIQGDLAAPTSFFNQEEGAQIKGTFSQNNNFPFTRDILPIVAAPETVRQQRANMIPILSKVAKTIGYMMVLLALGALMLLIMPKAGERMTAALIAKPWHMLGYGALTAAVMVAGSIVFTITICLIWVVLLAGLAFALALLVGWLALGYELGKRISASIFKQSWHPVLAAVIGNLVLYLVAKGLFLIPCIGSFLNFIAALFGLGMVVATLFGTLPYPRTGTPQDNQQEVLFVKDVVEGPEAKPAAPVEVVEPVKGEDTPKAKKITRRTKKTTPPDPES